ncbi:hypothetical protein [Jiella pelagia]|uniref:DUF3489 domain-containing protein n=1 Tax=Jiella pelagia TaxID=2986949 RepID=A0ABY7BX90_9HYPH|nr:hypothetical protein [Jiella pelagia]WAP68018.1 hypothetical protein OH818_21805 [Jiella pelagia]
MERDPVKNALIAKRSKIAAEVKAALETVAELNQKLAALDETLRLFGHEDPDPIGAKKLQKQVTHAEMRDRRTAIMEALRGKPGGASTKAIVTVIMARWGFDEGDREKRRHVMDVTRKSLERLEKRGMIVRDGWEGDARLWRIA